MTSDNVAKRGRVQYIQYRPQHRSLGHATPQVLATRCCPLHVDYLFTILKVGLKPAQGFAINTKATRESLQKNLVIQCQKLQIGQGVVSAEESCDSQCQKLQIGQGVVK